MIICISHESKGAIERNNHTMRRRKLGIGAHSICGARGRDPCQCGDSGGGEEDLTDKVIASISHQSIGAI
jgi:hypothetical protein